MKVLASRLALGDEFVSRFVHEAKIVNEVHSPNIVDIFDFVRVEAPRRVACVMELLEGVPLSRALASRPLTVTQALNACLQICRALEIVHARGVIHRDLKPDNLFVVGDLDGDLSEAPSVKVLDFGIAKVADARVGHRTASGALLGTPVYMAPEQMAAESVTPATDVYAVGEILYEMLTGARLFAGRGVELMSAKLTTEPPEVEIPDDIPFAPELAALIRRCVQKSPRARPSLGELVVALEAVRARLSVDTMVDPSLRPRSTSTPTDPSPGPARLLDEPMARPRDRGGWGVAALVVLTLAGVAGVAAWRRPEPVAVEATPEIARAAEPSPGPADLASSGREAASTASTAVARPPEDGPAAIDPSRPAAAGPETAARGPVEVAPGPARVGAGPEPAPDATARVAVAPSARVAAPARAHRAPRPPPSPAPAPAPAPGGPASAAPVDPPSAEPAPPSAPVAVRVVVEVDSVPTGAVVEDAVTRVALGATPLAVELTTARRSVILTSRGFAPARIELSADSTQSLVRLVPAIIQTEETRPW